MCPSVVYLISTILGCERLEGGFRPAISARGETLSFNVKESRSRV